MEMQEILKGIQADLGFIKSEMEEMKSLRLAIDNLSQIPSRVEVLEQEVANLKAEIQVIRSDVQSNKVGVQANKECIHEDRQYSRRDNLIISNVPYAEGENLRELVKALAASLGIWLKEWDIKVVHRLPTSDGVPKIVAKMHERSVKTEIIRRSKKAKLNSAFLNIDPDNLFPVYCEDHLTPQNQKLFAVARQLKKERRLGLVEVRDCAVRVAQRSDGRPIRVTSEYQLYGVAETAPPVPENELMEINEPAPSPNGSQAGGQKRDLETRSPDTAPDATANLLTKKVKERHSTNTQGKNSGSGSNAARYPKAPNGLSSPSTQRKMFQYMNQGGGLATKPHSQLQLLQGRAPQHNLLVKPYSHPLVQSQSQISAPVPK